jgi:hypothetical protein
MGLLNAGIYSAVLLIPTPARKIVIPATSMLGSAVAFQRKGIPT